MSNGNRIQKIAKGSFGSASVCRDLVDRGKRDLLDTVEKYSKNGWELWQLYMDVCGEDMDTTIKILEAFTLKMPSPEEVCRALNDRDSNSFLKGLIS